jgi:uncharacterized protein (UPF0218 family)
MDENLRKKLAQPFGPVFKSKSKFLKFFYKLKTKSAKGLIIGVGDYTNNFLLSLKINPNIGIFDKKIKRKKAPITFYKKFKNYAKKFIFVKNKAGEISYELLKTIKKILRKKSKKPVFIQVDGEEDLSALVFLKYCSKKDLIFYGLPNKGLAVLKPTKKNKQFANFAIKKLLEKK